MWSIFMVEVWSIFIWNHITVVSSVDSLAIFSFFGMEQNFFFLKKKFFNFAEPILETNWQNLIANTQNEV